MTVSGKDVLNLVFMVISSGTIVAGPLIMASQGTLEGGLGGFALHPLLMGLAFTLLFSLGFWMFNYEDLPGEWIDRRPSRRKIHVLFQLSGMACLGGGYYAVYNQHALEGQQIFVVSESASFTFITGPSWLKQAHVLNGYFVLALVALQLGIGILKYRAVTDEDERDEQAFKSHKMVGIGIYIFGMANVLLGVWLWSAWSFPFQAMLSLTLVTSIAFGPRWDGSRGYLADNSEPGPEAPRVIPIGARA